MFFLRHLFFTASGENITSYFVSRRKEKSGFADDVMEYRAVPDDEAGGLVPDSRAWLQKILAFYLYGRKHPLPIMERCMWNDNPAGVFRCYGQNGDYGDFQLDYVRLLWGDESLEAELQKKILELQNLRRFPVASDPPPEETD